MIPRRQGAAYSPGSDGALTMWFDPSDNTKVLAVGGGLITSGATIGTVNTSGGTARSFTQWGTNQRPTWQTGAFGTLAAILCTTNQILTTTTTTGFASMGGFSCLIVLKKTIDLAGAAALGMNIANGGNADISLVQMRCEGSYAAGGRRVGSDSFQLVSGNAYPGTGHILGAVYDYTNAKLSIYESGVQGLQGQTFQTAGSTPAGEPHGISIGGVAQVTSSNAFAFAQCYVGECLAWNTAMTPDQLYPANDYLRRKWGIS